MRRSSPPGPASGTTDGRVVRDMSLPGGLLKQVRRVLLGCFHFRMIREQKRRGMIQRCRDAIGTGLGGLTLPLGDRVEFDPEAAVLAFDERSNRRGRLCDTARFVSCAIEPASEPDFAVMRTRGVDRQRCGICACFTPVAEPVRGSGA